jgi:hypothetical protein
VLEKRIYPRYDKYLDVKVINGSETSFKTRNISRTGACIEMDRPYETKAIKEIAIKFKNRFVKAMCEVVWSNTDKCGVRFLDYSPLFESEMNEVI